MDSSESDFEDDELFDPNVSQNNGESVSIPKKTLEQKAKSMGVRIEDMTFGPSAAINSANEPRVKMEQDNEILLQRQEEIEADPIYQFTELLASFYPNRTINFWDRSSSKRMAEGHTTTMRLQDRISSQLASAGTGDVNYYINNVYAGESGQQPSFPLSPPSKTLLTSSARPRRSQLAETTVRQLYGRDETDEARVARSSVHWLNTYSLLDGEFKLGSLAKGVILSAYNLLLKNIDRFKSLHLRVFLMDAVIQTAFAQLCAAIGNNNEIRGNIRYAAQFQATLAPKTVRKLVCDIKIGFFWDEDSQHFYTETPIYSSRRRTSIVIRPWRRRTCYNTPYTVYSRNGRGACVRHIRRC